MANPLRGESQSKTKTTKVPAYIIEKYGLDRNKNRKGLTFLQKCHIMGQHK